MKRLSLIWWCVAGAFSLLTHTTASAQFAPCIDVSRQNYYYQCYDPYYNPVCGCDNKTYRNSCVAYNRYGVSTWRSGVCAGIDLDFLPNPALTGYNLTLNLSYDDNVYGNATIRIVDVYGKTVFQQMANNFTRIHIEVDVSTFNIGVYLIVVEPTIGQPIVRILSKA